MNRRGTLFVVTGPSGAGKGTVLSQVFQKLDRLYFSVSATTRAPRQGEVDQVHYFFISKDEFRDMIAQDRLLEYAEYVNNFYGTPEAPVEQHLQNGDDVILEIELQGALKVKAKRPDAVLVFIAPPSFEELRRRLTGRGTEKPEVIEQRLTQARQECANMEKYDYIVINDVLEGAVDELRSIIMAQRCVTAKRADLFAE